MRRQCPGQERRVTEIFHHQAIDTTRGQGVGVRQQPFTDGVAVASEAG